MTKGKGSHPSTVPALAGHYVDTQTGTVTPPIHTYLTDTRNADCPLRQG